MTLDTSEGEVLGEERRYFESIRDDLLAKSEGKFALIKHRELLGLFDTGEKAYQVGLSRLGNVPMLIVQVLREEEIARFPALHTGLIHAGIQD